MLIAKRRTVRTLFGGLLMAALAAVEQAPGASFHFEVSARDLSSQRYDVVLRCGGLGDSAGPVDFCMPAWTPGYYQLTDYARGVEDFSAENAAGEPLEWAKAGDGVWRVERGAEPEVVVRYRVRADKAFVAQSYLDPDRGYLCPAGVFLYAKGRLGDPVTVHVAPPVAGWTIATGLTPAGEPNTYSASDFDRLYDCPLLLGNLETLEFTAVGKPHAFVALELGGFEPEAFTRDLTKMIESASGILGDVPYDRYQFLAIGPGQGGIEHGDTCAVTFNPRGDARSPSRDRGFLEFLTHEYFHLYNAKRIRPIELGPFDYQQANRTRMLWVAEGFTLYYEHLILHRAGLTNREHLFKKLAASINQHESRPGRLVQSAVESSWNTWDEGPFGGDPETTVNCYTKGAVLGLVLDLAIRQATDGAKSLDDVMRLLYREYHQELGRGYTEQEFNEACREVAGDPLTEVLGYATDTAPIDYAKYLGYAGLKLVSPEEASSEEEEPEFELRVVEDPSESQRRLLDGWVGGDETRRP